MTKKICWCDTETGGVDYRTDALLQIAIDIEIDDEIVKSEVFYAAPFTNDKVNEKALQVNGFTHEQIRQFPQPKETLLYIEDLLKAYVNKFDPKDKFIFSGYNCRFDMEFLRKFFEKNGDNFFGSFFFSVPLDVMSFVAEAVIEGNLAPMKSFKLSNVCKVMGISLDNAHDASADIKATRLLYKALKDLTEVLPGASRD